MIAAVALGLLGCSGADADAIDGSEAAATKGTATITSAIYVAPPGQATPKGDYLPAMSVGIDAKRPVGTTPANSVRFLYDYPGSPTRVSGACLGEWATKGSDLVLTCPATPLTFSIVESDAKVLTLKNDKGEAFSLDRIDPEAKTDARAECDADPFTLRVDLEKMGTARRVVFHVTAKPNAFQGQSPQGIFVMTAAAGTTSPVTLEGTDFYEGEIEVKIPRDITADFKGSLKYYDAGGPYASSPRTYPLTCTYKR